jgi:hypothetical protein
MNTPTNEIFNEPTYALYQKDSHGVPHLVNSGLSHADATSARRSVYPTTTQIIIYEHHGKSVEPTHPASAFVHNAICHECGHAAAKHRNDGPCIECLNFSFSKSAEAPDKCSRKRENVLLDGIIDMAKSQIPLDVMIGKRSPLLPSLTMTTPDITGLGYVLKNTHPDVLSAREAIDTHFGECSYCNLNQSKICHAGHNFVLQYRIAHELHCPTTPYETITSRGPIAIANEFPS